MRCEINASTVAFASASRAAISRKACGAIVQPSLFGCNSLPAIVRMASSTNVWVRSTARTCASRSAMAGARQSAVLKTSAARCITAACSNVSVDLSTRIRHLHALGCYRSALTDSSREWGFAVAGPAIHVDDAALFIRSIGNDRKCNRTASRPHPRGVRQSISYSSPQEAVSRVVGQVASPIRADMRSPNGRG